MDGKKYAGIDSRRSVALTATALLLAGSAAVAVAAGIAPSASAAENYPAQVWIAGKTQRVTCLTAEGRKDFYADWRQRKPSEKFVTDIRKGYRNGIHNCSPA
ncbi:MAG: hypothetical protein ACRCYX_05590 [Dermatophilaceae bacterium]